MIDINRALKTAATTGDVRFGLSETKKSLLKGDARLVVVASNCPEKDSLSGQTGTKVLAFSGNNVELGSACGKPYAISALVIVSPGESNILSAA
ncbi:MAG TPA: 50S ribosomal protein L30e [Thermoplasmata archaeon]|jgi:large subunit ribosomal protein L30e|nr:50S ribosomal protein L30e [Thermoplasmata archaeon]HUS56958.1 50S ribosomal protein L30e [Thermoplasmata archaeon]